MSWITTLSLTGLALLLSGCGSFLGRMSHQPKPYPGIRFAVEQSKDSPFEVGEVCLWLEAPISLAFDTVLLPVDALVAVSSDIPLADQSVE